jgi:hypothetical protein
MDLARIRAVQIQDAFEQRGFTGAIQTDQAMNGICRHLQINGAQDAVTGKAFIQVLDLKYRTQVTFPLRIKKPVFEPAFLRLLKRL